MSSIQNRIQNSILIKKVQEAITILGEAAKGFSHNGGIAAAGNMAFLAMFCLFPFIIFLVSISGVMGQTEKGLEAITFILSLMPPEVSTAIDGPIQGILKNTGKEILTFSIIFALLTAANGIEAGREIVIRAFGREHCHGFWKRRIESLVIVITAAILVILAMFIQVIGPPIIKAANNLIPELMTGQMTSLWTWLSIAISPVILLLGLYILYLSLTPRSIFKPYRFPGAFFTLILFIITAKGLSTFLKSANTYDLTYGSLAGVVIAQLFCYIVSLGFIYGAELNAAWTRHSDRISKS